MNRIFATILALVISFVSNAQQQVEMADTMRDNGKIYVVVAVLAVIFLGITTYLVLIDKKVSKLEEEVAKK